MPLLQPQIGDAYAIDQAESPLILDLNLLKRDSIVIIDKGDITIISGGRGNIFETIH